MNAEIPLSDTPNPAARPFKMREDDPSFARALECLTSAIYYEAGNELADGQRAVAQVVLNRVRHPAYPSSVCAVVYQGSTRETGCQFTFTCDGALSRRPHPAIWERAKTIARKALTGSVFKPVGYATHYHANYVVPYWATSLAKNAIEGTHIFYRWSGWWGQPGAFRRRHAGAEPDPRQLRIAALQRKPPAVFPGEHVVKDEALALSVDPRVELISVVQFLAENSQASDEESAYRQAVREHFAPYSQHLAVQIYRQLSEAAKIDAAGAMQTMLSHSMPPFLQSQGRPSKHLVRTMGGSAALDGFVDALRDFAKVSDFDAFFAGRRSFYTELEKQARKPALGLAHEAQSESEQPVQRVKLIVAPLLTNERISGCAPASKVSEPWMILAAGKELAAMAKDKKLKELLVSAAEKDCPKLS